jgi:hypothetical protein
MGIATKAPQRNSGDLIREVAKAMTAEKRAITAVPEARERDSMSLIKCTGNA